MVFDLPILSTIITNDIGKASVLEIESMIDELIDLCVKWVTVLCGREGCGCGTGLARFLIVMLIIGGFMGRRSGFGLRCGIM